MGMFSGEFWGLLSSGGDVVGAACCRQNSWNSVMIILLLLTLPCNRGSSWPSTEGNTTDLHKCNFEHVNKPHDHRLQQIGNTTYNNVGQCCNGNMVQRVPP